MPCIGWDVGAGLWETFIKDGNCAFTPFLCLQAYEFLKDSPRSALASP